MNFVIARPKTIKQALDTAMRAQPPFCSRTATVGPGYWDRHQHRIIDTLERVLRQQLKTGF